MIAWTPRRAAMNNLEAYELWNYMRMLRISWAEQESNEQVFNMINTEI